LWSRAGGDVGRGRFAPFDTDDPESSLKAGKIGFELKGKKPKAPSPWRR